MAQCVYNSMHVTIFGITNSSYIKINKGTIQMPYIYSTIALEVQQHITTLLDSLYI